jgi:hypothetical protein
MKGFLLLRHILQVPVRQFCRADSPTSTTEARGRESELTTAGVRVAPPTGERHGPEKLKTEILTETARAHQTPA